MRLKEKLLEKELKRIRKENKEKFDSSKEDIKTIIDNAEHTIILCTDRGTVISANSLDLKNGVYILLEQLLKETDIDVSEILNMLKFIKEEECEDNNCIVIKAKSKEEAFEKLDKEISKIKKKIDKTIKEKEKE